MKREQEILIKRINDLCKQKGFTYYTLCNNSAVPLSTLMHIMDGTVKSPRLYTIIRLCGGFGITLAEFLSPEEFAEMLEALEIED